MPTMPARPPKPTSSPPPTSRAPPPPPPRPIQRNPANRHVHRRMQGAKAPLPPTRSLPTSTIRPTSGPSTTPKLKALILTLGVASITATGAWYGASLKIERDARKERERAGGVFENGKLEGQGAIEGLEKERGKQAEEEVMLREKERDREREMENEREKEKEEMVRKLEEARGRLVRVRGEVEGKIRGLEGRGGAGGGPGGGGGAAGS